MKSRAQPKSWLTLGLGILTGVIVGFIVIVIVSTLKRDTVHPLSSPISTTSTVQNNDSLTKRSESTPHTLTMESVNDPIRWDDLVEQLERQTADDLLNLFERTFDLTDRNLTEDLQEVVIVEFSRRNPKTALQLVWRATDTLKLNLVGIIFSEWSQTNIKEALVSAENLDQPYRSTALHAIVTTNSKLPREQWSELSVTHSFRHEIFRILREEEVYELINQPSEAWRSVVSDEIPNELQDDLLEHVLSQWIDDEGVQVVEKLYESTHEINPLHLERLLTSIVEHHVENAIDIVDELPQEFAHIVANVLAKNDAMKAYEIFHDKKGVDTSLLVHSIFQQWATNDPNELLQNVDRFKRTERRLAIDLGLIKLTKEAPDQAEAILNKLSGIPGVSAREVNQTFVRTLAQSDPVRALSWIDENEKIENRNHAEMLTDVLTNLVFHDLESAIEVALAQPPESYYVQHDYIYSLIDLLIQEGETTKVRGMIDSIQPSMQVFAVTLIGVEKVAEGDWDEIAELAEMLNKEERVTFYHSISSRNARENVVNLIESLDSIPSEEMQIEFAKGILNEHDNFGDILTDSQLKHVTSFLPTDESQN